MFSISPRTLRAVDHRPPVALPAPMGGGPGGNAPFCAGSFMENLPDFRPMASPSWCERLSQCLSLVGPVASASATAHRQLLALLNRLPDTIPGNTGLQAQLDRLQLAVGGFAMSRYPAGGEDAILEKLIQLSVAARNLEHLLNADYRQRWQPAHAGRPEPFAQLAEAPAPRRVGQVFQALL